MNRNPYKIYCDFESLLIKEQPVEGPLTKHESKKEIKTIVLNNHVAVSYCLYFKSYDKKDDKMITYKGLDCVDHLFNELK